MISESAFMIVLAFIARGASGQSTKQSPSSLVLKEGERLSINCTYEYSGYAYLFWYIQSSDSGTLQLLLRDVTGETTRNGFFANHIEKEKSFHLHKEAIDMSDSSTYFCACGPLYGGSYKFEFGSGTRLRVHPNLPESEPSVYELQPADEGKDLSACLFTDYSPGSITVSSDGSDHVETNSSVVVVEGEASYGAVLWNKNPQNLRCLAEYDEREFTAKSGTADACSGEQTSFQTDERLNLLSLTVLGLRVIFFKTVAINLLLTFRMWSR